MKCKKCEHYFWNGETIFYSKYGYGRYICQQCSERENMPDIKITAEVDGKQVPLNTISTESFEAIKALQKPKEIPVARIGNWPGNPGGRRLFLKITDNIRRCITERKDIKMVAIELKGGNVVNSWTETQQIPLFSDGDPYENVKPL